MTKKRDPTIIKGSRRKRIAITVVAYKMLIVIRNFEQTKKMFKQFSEMGKTIKGRNKLFS